jgi:hypothetical protein
LLGIALTKPGQVPPKPHDDPAGERGGPTEPPRRIVVQPDQIFPRYFQSFSRPTFEGVIIRYVLISAAVVSATSIATMVLIALLRH